MKRIISEEWSPDTWQKLQSKIKEGVEMIKRYWVYYLSILCGAILFIILLWVYQKLRPSDIILIITAIIIFIYTYETYKLRKATVNHTKIYTIPVLILLFETDNRSQDVHFRLHNSGNSPAYNAKFQKTEFGLDGQESVLFRLKLGNVGIVPPEDKIEVSLAETGKQANYDRVSSKQLFKFINSARARGEHFSLRTTVFYDDILGYKWKSKLGFDSTTGFIARKPESV